MYGDSLDSIIMQDEPMYLDSTYNEAYRDPDHYLALTRKIRDAGWTNLQLSLAFFGRNDGFSVSQNRYFVRYLPAIDKLRINLFPFYRTHPLGMIVHWIDCLHRQMAESAQIKPLTVTLQTWVDKRKNYPPIEQLRVMAHLVLLCGVEGLSFFDFNPVEWPDHFHRGFVEMMKDLVDLRDELEGASVRYYLDGLGTYDAGVSQYPDGMGVFEAEVRKDSEALYYTINTTPNDYEIDATFVDLKVIEAFGIIRSHEPIMPYPPKVPYPRPRPQRPGEDS